MISKRYRLRENDVRKVLKYKKPFFSFGMIANVRMQKGDTPRFAILLSGKHTHTSISRNFYRRFFYELVRPYCLDQNALPGRTGGVTGFTEFPDVVFVPKKGRVYDLKDEQARVWFERDVKTLLSTIFPPTCNKSC